MKQNDGKVCSSCMFYCKVKTVTTTKKKKRQNKQKQKQKNLVNFKTLRLLEAILTNNMIGYEKSHRPNFI